MGLCTRGLLLGPPTPTSPKGSTLTAFPACEVGEAVRWQVKTSEKQQLLQTAGGHCDLGDLSSLLYTCARVLAHADSCQSADLVGGVPFPCDGDLSSSPCRGIALLLAFLS